MFGTLVIQLPSNYSGGELAIYHQSKSKKFDFGGFVGCNNFHYAAFYADCQHEIKPVTKGYRLCLIYNLVYRGSDNCPSPADNQQIISAVVASMKEWSKDIPPEKNPQLMTYLLEHKYCDASLSFQLLKNSDRAVADVLTQAKKEVEFDLYIAKVSLVEIWAASHDRHYNFTADELCDETITAENLTSLEGQQSISSIEITRNVFVPEKFFDSHPPDKEEFAEATGNEGATCDKQYNWAALLLWPTRNRIRSLGLENMVQLFKSDISQEKKVELEVVAKDLIRECTSPSKRYGDYIILKDVPQESYVSLLESLRTLGKVDLVSEFLNVIASLYSSLIGNSSFSIEILAIGLKFGWDMLRSPLQAIFGKLSSSDNPVGKYVHFLHKISQQPSSEVQ